MQFYMFVELNSRKMYKSALGLIFCFFILSGFIQNAESYCPFVPTKPLPYETLSPIDVNTKTAIPANTTTPLILKNPLLDTLLLKNTGYALEVFPNSTYISSGIYGGVLCHTFYKFYKLRFYFTSDLKARSNDLVDGVSTPLTLSIIYYNNLKYGSFEESLKHRDGLVIANFQLKTGHIPNILFIPVGFLIRLLREPGAEIPVTPDFLAFAWFNDIPFITKYYTYPGSYYDIEKDKHYECATIIVADGQYPQLSELQYQAFLSLKSVDGSRLEPTSPRVYPAGKRPVYFAYGFQGRYPFF